jgi:C-terminal processing protease CtpA/Prc
VPQRAPAQPDDGSVVGIGVGLALDSNHNLCISSLLPGSPAKRSGLLEEGDILRYIDGKDVRGLVPEDVRPLILGRPGTYVTLSVQRGNTQIVARMARAKPTAEAAAPRAGSTTAPKADANTFSSAYAQATANKQEVQQNNVQQQQQAPAPEPPKARQAPQPNNSSLPRPAPSAATKEEEPELCGIGIVLSQNGQGELLVLSMNEGGPAARSNLIKKNDVLYTIDSTDVYKKTIEQVRCGIPRRV